jgi:hypothetical protein
MSHVTKRARQLGQRPRVPLARVPRERLVHDRALALLAAEAGEIVYIDELGG